MKHIKNQQVQQIPIKINRYEVFLKRLKGLMFRMKPITSEGIYIKPCNSIHMFFMFFAIDVVFLSEENQIVSLHENVKPWTMIFPIKGASAALELPKGTIAKYSFHIGDHIEL